MNILVVGIRWPAETFLNRLLEGLHKAGHSVTISHKDKPKRTPGYCANWIHPFFLKFISLKRWDIIYFPWNSSAIENLNLFDRGVPCVVSCRGSQVNVAPHNPNRQALKRGLAETFKKAAAVHCVSEAIKREAEQYGLDPAKAHVIRPGVDPDFFVPKEKKKDKVFRVVSAGNLVWHKGYEYALQAIRMLKDQGIDVEYKIIGEGQEQQRVLYTIHDLNLQKNVKLLGRLTPEKVREILQGSDAFLLSSVTEGISNAVLEAMACELPIVTTNCGGMREAVMDGVEGFVLPVRDPEAMAEKIQLLAKNQELRAKMGQAARKRVQNQFRSEDQIKAFIHLFEEAKAHKNA